jgi:hypothetical protein
MKGHLKKTGVIEQLDYLSEEMNWSGFRDALTGLGVEHRGALRDTDV